MPWQAGLFQEINGIAASDVVEGDALVFLNWLHVPRGRKNTTPIDQIHQTLLPDTARRFDLERTTETQLHYERQIMRHFNWQFARAFPIKWLQTRPALHPNRTIANEST